MRFSCNPKLFSYIVNIKILGAMNLTPPSGWALSLSSSQAPGRGRLPEAHMHPNVVVGDGPGIGEAEPGDVAAHVHGGLVRHGYSRPLAQHQPSRGLSQPIDPGFAAS